MVKLIKPSAEIYELNSLKDITVHIEKCGRTCYKSEDKITADSADKFIAGILRSGHESVVEHANFIFSVANNAQNKEVIFLIKDVKGLNITNSSDRFIISGNARAFRDCLRFKNVTDFNHYFKENNDLSIFYIDVQSDNNSFTDLKFENIQNDAIANYGDKHNYITAHLICDLGVYKDITRHRLASYSIESTRYCNYSKDKFDNELNMIVPCNLQKGTQEYKIWLDCMNNIEKSYMEMGKIDGIKADNLRMMLPHSIKADVVMTANVEEWKHVFALRCTKKAHPSVNQVMLMLLAQFVEKYPSFNFADLLNEFGDEKLEVAV